MKNKKRKISKIIIFTLLFLLLIFGGYFVYIVFGPSIVLYFYPDGCGIVNTC